MMRRVYGAGDFMRIKPTRDLTSRLQQNQRRLNRAKRRIQIIRARDFMRIKPALVPVSSSQIESG